MPGVPTTPISLPHSRLRVADRGEEQTPRPTRSDRRQPRASPPSDTQCIWALLCQTLAQKLNYYRLTPDSPAREQTRAT